MSAASLADPVQIARDYYNSDDADNFYYEIWGGEDIHIGLYESESEPIPTASERTVATMAAELAALDAQSRVADFGAGYGGSARWLAQAFGCHVSCVNLSEVQNRRNREITAAAGLSDLIDVYDASFESAPLEDASFDCVWSQDSLLHAGKRHRVLEEVDRILKPGGEFIFTDPMQADDCPPGVLQPVLDRLHLDSLGSFAYYRAAAKKLGWTELGIRDLTSQLVNHYTRVRQELAMRRSQLADRISEEYVDRMLQGLGNWVDAGVNGHIAWGILHFRK
ncbi:MAG: methyltransferase domain-containing protein [Gammaproteobacteria bacterium]|jgi:sarcosine/dimethylglycine N-methyltransferase